MAKPPDGFVPLKSLKPHASREPALAELRQIYFKTTKRTIEQRARRVVAPLCLHEHVVHDGPVRADRRVHR